MVNFGFNLRISPVQHQAISSDLAIKPENYIFLAIDMFYKQNHRSA
jgi:hypothetical protein